MSSRDYLSPFAVTNRAICEGVDEREVINLITRYVTETLNIAGCFIKIRTPEQDEFLQKKETLDLGKGSHQVKFTQGSRLELYSSFGLSESFLYSKVSNAPASFLNQIPEENIYIEDISQLSEKEDDCRLLEAEGLRSFFLFPVDIDQEDVALVALFDTKGGDLTREDIKFAKAITSRGIAFLVMNRDMERLIELKRRYLKSFQKISQAVSSTLDVNKVLQLAVNTIGEVLGTTGAQIRLLNTKNNQLELAASQGLSERFLRIGPVYSKRKTDADHSGKVVVINDVANEPRIQYKEAILAESINTIVSAPMVIKGKIIGELTLFTGAGRGFSEEEIEFTKAIAQQCALAIDNARIYQRIKDEYQHLLEDFGYEGSS
ncbi:MAG: GAF domain-containing protein [Desulfohalobiaceae bacterium]|nr:GAF domain-containing protein [Desulfohalobiaceae bacterium]